MYMVAVWVSIKDSLSRRKVDIRLPEKGNSNSRGARPGHQIVSMIKWIWTSRLSIKNSLSRSGRASAREPGGLEGYLFIRKRLLLGPIGRVE